MTSRVENEVESKRRPSLRSGDVWTHVTSGTEVVVVDPPVDLDARGSKVRFRWSASQSAYQSMDAHQFLDEFERVGC